MSNPFLKPGFLNGKPTVFNNTHHGVLYPRFDVKEGAMLGTFNHLASGKTISLLAVPAQGGYALCLHEGKDVIARGKLLEQSGKIAYAGIIGDVPIVAFSANNDHGRYLQVRPDTQQKERTERTEQLRGLVGDLFPA